MTSDVAYPTPLKSNGFILEGNERRLGRLTPSNPHAPINELREQFEAQGYLWLKGILDRKAIFAFRKRFFSAFAETGLLKPGTDPVTQNNVHRKTESSAPCGRIDCNAAATRCCYTTRRYDISDISYQSSSASTPSTPSPPPKCQGEGLRCGRGPNPS